MHRRVVNSRPGALKLYKTSTGMVLGLRCAAHGGAEGSVTEIVGSPTPLCFRGGFFGFFSSRKNEYGNQKTKQFYRSKWIFDIGLDVTSVQKPKYVQTETPNVSAVDFSRSPQQLSALKTPFIYLSVYTVCAPPTPICARIGICATARLALGGDAEFRQGVDEPEQPSAENSHFFLVFCSPFCGDLIQRSYKPTHQSCRGRRGLCHTPVRQ